jgi:Cys-tRNA(Pro)/Cys-tRNA(Cys) deacylase
MEKRPLLDAGSMKTNAIRIIESKKIVFTTVEYAYDEDDLNAVGVADAIGAPPEIVFKTLVARNDKNAILVFVIPSDFELDLKKAAAAACSKNVAMLKAKELLPATGYIRGGCSPFGMKKLFPTFIDETAQLHDKISVSAGIRGMQVYLAPTDLIALVAGTFADLT